MNLLRFIPIKLTLLLVLGIILGSNYNMGIVVPITLTLSLLFFLGILFYLDTKKTTALFGIVVTLLTVSIGLLAVSLSKPKYQPDHYSNQNFVGNHTWHVKIREVLKPTSYSNRYVVDVRLFENRKVTGKVLLSSTVDSSNQLFNVDDELTFFGALDSIKPPLNPYQFDYRKYLNGLGISHQIRLQSHNFFASGNPSKTIYGRAAATRNFIINKLKKANFGTEELGVIQALLLGQRNDISAETYDNYKNAGAVHILAVSGLHIGVLLFLLQFLLRPLERLPRGRTLKLVVIVGLLWGFALLAGLSASIVRAVTMFSFVAYALYLNRPSNTFNILALSMFFILLVLDPNLLFHVGFQMSYAAVLAIVWLYPLMQQLWRPKSRVIRYFWQLLSVSIAAQLGVLPISLFYFHQFPGLFFISNLVIVPALGIILGMGILIIILATLNRLPNFLVSIYDALIGWMNTIVSWVAKQEAFVFKNISFDALQLILAYAIICSAVLFFTKPNFKRALPLALAIMGFQIWLIHLDYKTHQKEAIFLMHQARNSALLYQNGENLIVAAQDADRVARMVTDYQVAERITHITYDSMQNSYRWGNKSIFVMDSLAIYPAKKLPLDYLVLTQSPRVNLERVLDSIEPKLIIADGNNYRSYIDRWSKTCKKRKLPFHYTGEKGAYCFTGKD